MDTQENPTNEHKKATLQDYIDKLQEHYDLDEHKDKRWYKRIVTDCNKYIPNTLRHTTMEDITPEMLQEAINRVCRLGGKRYQSIASGIRDCFRLASLDDAITANPALSVHIREVNTSDNPIDDELYQEILKQVREVPGGFLFGLAGFADTSMATVARLTFEECDPHNHSLRIRHRGKERIARIADPDGIALFDDVIQNYEKRMEDPSYAHNNSSHTLCTNRFGLPYEAKQLNTIGELLREACNSPNVDMVSFRRFIRYRQL